MLSIQQGIRNKQCNTTNSFKQPSVVFYWSNQWTKKNKAVLTIIPIQQWWNIDHNILGKYKYQVIQAVTFSSPSWRSPTTIWRGHVFHPKKVKLNRQAQDHSVPNEQWTKHWFTQVIQDLTWFPRSFCCYFFSPLRPSGSRVFSPSQKGHKLAELPGDY